jgi:molybdate transport system permease protein
MDWTAFTLSLKLAGWTCALILPVSIVLARWLAWGRFGGKSLLEALIMLPLVLPPTVLGYYLLIGFAPDTILGHLVSALGGRPLVFSFNGILVASLIANLPFAVQPMARSFEAIPIPVREAAWVSGLSSWETFRRIEIPLAWPGLLSGLVLTFAHTIGEFGVILMIGGNIPGETQTLSISLYDQVQAFRHVEAGIMAATLLGFSFLSIAVVHALGRRRRSQFNG